MSAPSAPSVYGYQNSPQADRGAFSAIQSLPGAVAATGYNPANTVQQGQNVISSVQGLLPYSQAALETGFDPQNQLYNRAFNQNQQQNLASQVAQGVSGTPYGAGLTNEANENFNLDWQNRALQRQAQGAATAQGLLGEYGSNTALGSGLEQAGGQFGLSVPQMQALDYMNYLQGGSQAANARTNAFNSTQAANQAYWGGLGQLGGAALGALPSFF